MRALINGSLFLVVVVVVTATPSNTVPTKKANSNTYNFNTLYVLYTNSLFALIRGLWLYMA